MIVYNMLKKSLKKPLKKPSKKPLKKPSKKPSVDSPKEHANDHPGKIIRGLDYNEYISVKDKNGIYKWIKLSFKKTPEEYYKLISHYTPPKFDSQIFTSNVKNLARELKQNGIIFIFIKWGKYTPQYEYEYLFEDTNIDGMNLIIYSENRLYWDARDSRGMMSLIHQVDKEMWPIVNRIFIKYFPKRTLDITSHSNGIQIFFNEKTKIKKDIEKNRFAFKILFQDRTLSSNTEIYVNKLEKIMGKKIGFVSEYDVMFGGGKLYISFDVNVDKIEEFKQFIENLEKNNYDGNLPKIRKIKSDDV